MQAQTKLNNNMESYKGNIVSKMSGVGTSIFAVMSKKAVDHKAINLSQGFPNFPVAEDLVSLIHDKMQAGYNQYAPMPGVPALLDSITEKVAYLHGAEYDAQSEITVTAGATQALFTAISAFVKEDDEVIVFEPAYDSYAPAIRLNGGIVKHVPLKLPDYHIDWDEVAQLVSRRTRMIILNSPHNPTGAVLSQDDIDRLNKLTKNSEIIILSDEVYEHIIFDDKKHLSVLSCPDLGERSIVVASFGKTFHATGWKMGYVTAPANLMKEFRKVHQFNVFCVNTPIQYALAEYLKKPSHYEGLGAFYQQKRDFFLDSIKGSSFKPIPSYGTYFQLLDYSAISDKSEMDFADWLIEEHKVAGIPVSAFYNNQQDNKILRFCFAKTEDTLSQAAQALCKL